MLVLTISLAQGGAQAALVRDGAVTAIETLPAAHGVAVGLPLAVARLLRCGAASPALVAAVTGPGSFTGLRAGLSLAQGLALGLGVPVQGVTVAEALGRAAARSLDGRILWVALAARTGHVFLDHDGAIASWALDALPAASGRVAVAGDAANMVAAALAARGTDVMLVPQRIPAPAHIAAIGLARQAGELAPRAALPLYGEAALARPAAGGRGPPKGGLA